MTDLSYDVVFSRRKTIALSLDPGGNLTVRAPLRTGKNVIEDVILRHRSWIIQKQHALAEAKSAHPEVRICDGAEFPYLGGSLTLQIADAAEVKRIGDTLQIPPSADGRVLVAWLKDQLRPILTERCAYFGEKIAVRPQSVGITSAKTRWGSCSASNRLNFTFRLIFCPPDVIDYVVLHELSHIRHKNHSAQFWQQVGSVLPEYASQRLWLKKNALLMEIFA
ncbi:MAG: M48 family metallopeptidase [Clostridia bacterium]|nr:M48 family metallopeptidase [Clostridia bacterium]